MRRAVAVDVVEEPAGLVLLNIQTSQPHQLPAVVTCLDHFGLDRHQGAAVAVADLEFGHVETPVVEAAQVAIEFPAVGGGERHGLSQQCPEMLVTRP